MKSQTERCRKREKKMNYISIQILRPKEWPLKKKII